MWVSWVYNSLLWLFVIVMTNSASTHNYVSTLKKDICDQLFGLLVELKTKISCCSTNITHHFQSFVYLYQFPLFHNILSTINRSWKIMLKLLIFVFKELWEIEYHWEYHHNTTIDGCVFDGHILHCIEICKWIHLPIYCAYIIYLNPAKSHVSFKTHNDCRVHRSH